MASMPPADPPDTNPLVACQLPAWYPHHEQHSLKTIVISLPPDFLLYLQEDGIFLPDDSAAVPQLNPIDAALITDGDYRRDDWGPTPPVGGTREGGSAADSDSEEDDSPGDSGSEARGRDWTARFPALRAALDAAIASLGGRAVPKLNWSCPSDALWVSGDGSLACRNAEQVILLLKSSDRTAHDVDLLARVAEGGAPVEAEGGAVDGAPAAGSASGGRGRSSGTPPGPAPPEPEAATPGAASADGGVTAGTDGAAAEEEEEEEEAAAVRSGREGGGGAAAGPGPSSDRGSSAPAGSLLPVLALKKWYNLRPEREFRCFVRAGRLVATCQRDISQAFPALTEAAVADVRQRLWRFWEGCMRGRGPLMNFAYDVYVPYDNPAAVRLVDVNPITDTTSPLLYDWAELGFRSGEVPTAAALLQQLLTPQPQSQHQQQPDAGAASGAAVPSGQGGPQTSGASDVDESWMEGAVGLAAALPVPSSEGELQVRVVQAAPSHTSGPDGPGGLSGLVGPMLLGSRAALAMPYDMLGIADSVDKMVEIMERQRQQQQQRGRGRESEEEEEGESEGSGRERPCCEGEEDGRGEEEGQGWGREEGSPDPAELAALFGGGWGAAGTGAEGAEFEGPEDAEAAETVAEMVAIMEGGRGA